MRNSRSYTRKLGNFRMLREPHRDDLEPYTVINFG